MAEARAVYYTFCSEQKRRLKEEKKAKEKAEKLAALEAQQQASANKKKTDDEDIDPNVSNMKWNCFWKPMASMLFTDYNI